MIYLDNNATTPVDPAVLDAMLPFLRGRHENPSSAYRGARAVRAALDEARACVARLLSATPEEIVFTSGGTEADNAVIESARALSWPSRRRLVIGATEHPAVMEPALRWEQEGGSVTRVPVGRDGVIDLAAFEQAVAQPDVALASIMWANNETGALAPMHDVVRIAHAAGVLIHTDAVQAVGKVGIDLASVPVDYVSLSGHKIHAPKGVGALFVSRRVRFRPWMLGGGQEHGRRSGTENVPGIIGLGVAAELMQRQLADGTTARVAALRDAFEKQVLAALPGAFCTTNTADTRVRGSGQGGPGVVDGGSTRALNAAGARRSGATSSFCLPGVDAAGMLILLDAEGVCCSAGSACHAGAVHPSPVLEAMGLDAAHAASTLRFSFSRFNTEAEAHAAAASVIAAAGKLRALKDGDEGPVVVSAPD
ncbi:MAG: cysteine desulfurase [Verrucomicrobiaceae bacterium]|nr:cysteine desulfurase [Verrucomicrobiaceae bacterium]